MTTTLHVTTAAFYKSNLNLTLIIQCMRLWFLFSSGNFKNTQPDYYRKGCGKSSGALSKEIPFFEGGHEGRLPKHFKQYVLMIKLINNWLIIHIQGSACQYDWEQYKIPVHSFQNQNLTNNHTPLYMRTYAHTPTPSLWVFTCTHTERMLAPRIVFFSSFFGDLNSVIYTQPHTCMHICYVNL